MEVELIDDHRLTLPPAKAAWNQERGATEVRLRLSRLDRLRRQRLWTFPLHYAGRISSQGIWACGPTLEQQLQHKPEVRQAELLRRSSEPRVSRSEEGGAANAD